MTRKLSAIIVGAGHRAMVYAGYALEHPAELAIVGVADPSPLRRAVAAARFNLTPAQCHESAAALAALPKHADFVINGTMDRDHVPTSLPLLAAGYDLLLEIPFATTEDELWQLARAARLPGHTISICHVLRYAPFYAAIRQRVIRGIIGELLNVQAVEPSRIITWRSGLSAANGTGRSLRLVHAHVQVMPRPRPHRLDEDRRVPRAGIKRGWQLSVSTRESPARRRHPLSRGLPDRGRLPLLGAQALHRPPGTLGLLRLGRPRTSVQSHDRGQDRLP
jgi:hypothetical protein